MQWRTIQLAEAEGQEPAAAIAGTGWATEAAACGRDFRGNSTRLSVPIRREDL